MVLRQCFLAVVVGLAGCTGTGVDPAVPKSLAGVLDNARTTAGLVGIAGGMISNGTIRVHASGLRKVGAAPSVTPSDRFQLGSLTKGMTATLAGTLVRDHQLAWSTTIADVFPDLASSIPEPFRAVTLLQLLQHRGGITPIPSTIDEASVLPPAVGTIREQRLHFVSWAVRASDPTSIDSFQYSNSGYVIAAAMCERVTGRSWEELMRERLFMPLGIVAEFGWPAEGHRDQPWGHTLGGSSVYMPVDPDGEVQFPDVLSPAGQLSMSVEDYLKFLQLQLDGLRGGTPVLPGEIAEVLHTPRGGYAMGWVVTKDASSGQPLSFHDGDDGTFVSFAVIRPREGRACIVFTNCSGPGVNGVLAQACVDILHEVR